MSCRQRTSVTAPRSANVPGRVPCPWSVEGHEWTLTLQGVKSRKVRKKGTKRSEQGKVQALGWPAWRCRRSSTPFSRVPKAASRTPPMGLSALPPGEGSVARTPSRKPTNCSTNLWRESHPAGRLISRHSSQGPSLGPRTALLYAHTLLGESPPRQTAVGGRDPQPAGHQQLLTGRSWSVGCPPDCSAGT